MLPGAIIFILGAILLSIGWRLKEQPDLKYLNLNWEKAALLIMGVGALLFMYNVHRYGWSLL
jgi:hypothetical protein